MSKLQDATAAIDPNRDLKWTLIRDNTGVELKEGDCVFYNRRSGYTVCAIDSRVRRVLILGEGTNDSPHTVSPGAIGATWKPSPA